MKVVDFKPEHLDMIDIQAGQAHAMGLIHKSSAEVLARELSLTAMEDDVVKACAGLLPLGMHRAVMWAYLSQNLSGKGMLRMTKWAKIFFEDQDYSRIEAHVECDFPQAHRWIKMLGFHCECERMEKFGEEGEDVAMYVRIQ